MHVQAPVAQDGGKWARQGQKEGRSKGNKGVTPPSLHAQRGQTEQSPNVEQRKVTEIQAKKRTRGVFDCWMKFVGICASSLFVPRRLRIFVCHDVICLLWSLASDMNDDHARLHIPLAAEGVSCEGVRALRRKRRPPHEHPPFFAGRERATSGKQASFERQDRQEPAA